MCFFSGNAEEATRHNAREEAGLLAVAKGRRGAAARNYSAREETTPRRTFIGRKSTVIT